MKTLVPEDDLALCAMGGDPAAFARLYERHLPVARARARRYLRCAHLAEDVVQDAFLVTWRERARFDPARSSFRAWLLTIVTHRAIDVLRRGARAAAAAEGLARDRAPGASPPLDEVLRAEERHEIRTAVRRLPTAQAIAVSLAYGEDLTAAQIAARTSAPLGTVKSRIRLGLVRLRAQATAAA